MKYLHSLTVLYIYPFPYFGYNLYFHNSLHGIFFCDLIGSSNLDKKLLSKKNLYLFFLSVYDIKNFEDIPPKKN